MRSPSPPSARPSISSRSARGLFEQVTGLREGGPFDQVEFYGTGDARRLSFAASPFMNWHYAGPVEEDSAGD